MRSVIFIALAGSLSGCTEIEIAPVPAPAPLACTVVLDEAIEGMRFEGKIAVSGDGSVFVVWEDEGFRAARRSPRGWERIDGAAAGAPVGEPSLTGTVQGAAVLLVGGDYEPTTLWRFIDGGWHLALETESDGGGNQSDDNLAAAPDGSLHFALNLGQNGASDLQLLALAQSAEAPVSLGQITDGRDPMLAVDARGARHVVYQEEAEGTQTLVYLSSDGSRHTLPRDRTGWPSLAVSADALMVFSTGDTTFTNGEPMASPPSLLTSRDGETWGSSAALEPISEPCPDLGTWNHESIGEACQHHVYRDAGHRLLGGERGLLLLRERREVGTKVWDCSPDGEQMCFWTRATITRKPSACSSGASRAAARP
jgi:hypothetical protein